MENKNRFSTLRVFKLGGSSRPPPLPPKDIPGPYHISPYNPYMTSIASTSQLTLGSIHPDIVDSTNMHSTIGSQIVRSPVSDERFLHPPSPNSSPRSLSPSRSPPGTATNKKGLSRFSPFGKRAKTTGSVPHSPSLNALPERITEDGDEDISAPWNFQVYLLRYVL